MVSFQEKYDSAFLAILQSEGKLPPFLDHIFSFLYRKTDFFRLMKTSDDRMGFPPGVAFKLVTDAYKKYENLAKRDEKEREKRQQEERARQKEAEARLIQAKVTDLEEISPVVKELEVTISQTSTENCDKVSEKKNNSESKDKGTEIIQDSKNTNSNQTVKEKQTDPPKLEKSCVQSNSQATTEDKHPTNTSISGSSKENKEDDDPELTKLQQVYQANPESYNGAVRDKYSWSQSITDLDVRIKVGSHIKRGKEVKVGIKRKHLSASCLTADGKMEELISGDLCWDINQEESMWTLVPGEHIHVNLEKVQERWWDAVLTNEPKISVRKIDPSRPMTDLDDEAQAKIEEMMYNEQRKRMGLPQSHEVKMHDMLRNAWDAEGSPFKGQPFDPSKLNISAPGQPGMMNMP